MRLNVNVAFSVDVNITKECTECHEVKPLEAFSKKPAGKFGRDSKCKVCKNAYNKMKSAEYKAANELLSMIELWERTPEKKCCRCKKILSSVEFYRNDSRKDGLTTKCRSCCGDDSSQYTKDNPEWNRCRNARYRAKKKGLFLEDFTYEQIVERDGAEACAYCHTTEGPFDVDHIFPLNLEGWHMPDNLVLACVNHNRSKQATHPAIYIKREGHSPNATVLRALTREHELTRTPIKEEI